MDELIIKIMINCSPCVHPFHTGLYSWCCARATFLRLKLSLRSYGDKKTQDHFLQIAHNLTGHLMKKIQSLSTKSTKQDFSPCSCAVGKCAQSTLQNLPEHLKFPLKGMGSCHQIANGLSLTCIFKFSSFKCDVREREM